MQLTLWKKILCLYIIAYAGFRTFFYIWKNMTNDYSKFHVTRLCQVIDINFLMLLGSVFVWARLKLLFSATTTVDVMKKSHPYGLNDHLSIEKKDGQLYTFHLVFFVFALMAHLAHFTFYFYSGSEPGNFVFLCLFCFGLWTHLVIFLIGFSVLNFLIRLCQIWKFGRESLKPCFRFGIIKNFLTDAKCQTGSAFFASIVFGVFLLYGAYNVQVNEIEIVVKRLPEKFDGFKIALLTDLHAGPTVGRTAFWRVVNATNRLDADVVAISGDLVDGSVKHLKEIITPLKSLHSRYGTYFTTGNHEYYYGNVDEWLSYFTTLNIKPLINQHVNLYADNDKIGDPNLCLAGVNDIYTNYVQVPNYTLDIRKALNGCDEASPKIVLAHNPKGAKLVAEQEPKVDLILAGHVHAGQMYIVAPFMYMTSPYFYGLYKHENQHTQIYVSSGTYFWGAPMKMPGFAQIVLITLRK